MTRHQLAVLRESLKELSYVEGVLSSLTEANPDSGSLEKAHRVACSARERLVKLEEDAERESAS